MSLADSRIKGIAKSNDLVLTTLNTRDFRGMGLEVVEARQSE